MLKDSIFTASSRDRWCGTASLCSIVMQKYIVHTSPAEDSVYRLGFGSLQLWCNHACLCIRYLILMDEYVEITAINYDHTSSIGLVFAWALKAG